MNQSTIKIDVLLDANKMPEQISWSATDSSTDTVQKAKAMCVAFWDGADKTALRIDLIGEVRRGERHALAEHRSSAGKGGIDADREGFGRRRTGRQSSGGQDRKAEHGHFLVEVGARPPVGAALRLQEQNYCADAVSNVNIMMVTRSSVKNATGMVDLRGKPGI